MVRDVDRFLVAMRQAGRSRQTIRIYGWHLARMRAWMEEHGVVSVGEVDRDLIRLWGAGLRDGWAPATVKSAVCSARVFFRWCESEGLIASNPGLALVVPKVQERVQRVLTLDEVRRLMAVCDRSSVKGLRDVALINVLIDTGLRSSEVCRVSCDRVDLPASLLVVRVKGGQEQMRFFGDATRAALRSWLAVRLTTSDVPWLFVSVGGATPCRQLTVPGLRTILRKIGDVAGVKGVTTHAFRRAFAVVATEAGAPSRLVQLAGGWRDIRMVERYTKTAQAQQMYLGGWSPGDLVKGDER